MKWWSTCRNWSMFPTAEGGRGGRQLLIALLKIKGDLKCRFAKWKMVHFREELNELFLEKETYASLMLFWVFKKQNFSFWWAKNSFHPLKSSTSFTRKLGLIKIGNENLLLIKIPITWVLPFFSPDPLVCFMQNKISNYDRFFMTFKCFWLQKDKQFNYSWTCS